MFKNLTRCSQSINSLIYVHSIQIPCCFLWVLDHSRDHTSSYYLRPKNLLYYLMFTYYGGTERSGELWNNCSISNDLTQTVNFPNWIPDLILTVLLFWRCLFLLTLVFLKLVWCEFWRNAYSVLKDDKSAIAPLFNGPEVLSSASDKAKLFAENFSKNSDLDDSGISLHVFSSRTNLKLHNISVTPKMVKKVIMNLDLSKASGPNCIPVVVLKNCESELL